MLADAHAHVIPGSFPETVPGCDPVDWPRMEPADGGARVLASGPLRFTARQAWFDAERRLAASVASGVDAEVVSPFPPLLDYRLAPGPGRDLARWVNEYVAGLCAAAPGRIYGLGTVPLQDPDLAAAELEDVAKAGLAGVEIASNIGGASLADRRFLGFFAEAERLGTASSCTRCRRRRTGCPLSRRPPSGSVSRGRWPRPPLSPAGSRRSTRGSGWPSVTRRAGSR